jgi:hypothetical protein
MEVFVACSGKWHDPPEDNPDGEISRMLPPEDGHWTTQPAAREQAHGRFLLWAAKEKDSAARAHTTLRPDVVVWAPARENPDHDTLWVLYERAAPAMGDDTHEFYPQMRETGFWVKTIQVREGAPPEPVELEFK